MSKADKSIRYMKAWREDWCKFAHDVLHACLDKEQKAILESVQHNPMTAVASGTSRGEGLYCRLCCYVFLCILPLAGRMVNWLKIPR